MSNAIVELIISDLFYVVMRLNEFIGLCVRSWLD